MSEQELRDELKAPVEPLLPIEKKLIGWSLGIGVALLALLAIVNHFLPVLMTDGTRGAASDWNPALYMKFVAERTRAARDLLAGVPLAAARRVADLGCGPGNSAELLLLRFPEARVVGLDTSEAMLAHARERVPGARFVRQDIAAGRPKRR